MHNPRTGMKDLQRLPGLVAIAYQHETPRCGDPHLHTHVIVPNRQARADGLVVSIDSKWLFHEGKAAGVVYQAVLRHELHAELGLEWGPVDPFTGMAEIAAVPKEDIKAWSRRASRLRDWAHHNLVVVDGAPSAQQLVASQKSTRPAKPETSRGPSFNRIGAPMRAVCTWTAPRMRRRALRAARTRTSGCGHGWGAWSPTLIKPRARARTWWSGWARSCRWTRPGRRALIKQIVDAVGIRVSAPRQAHHREGHEMFTVDAVIAEEERIFDMVDTTDTRG